MEIKGSYRRKSRNLKKKVGMDIPQRKESLWHRLRGRNRVKSDSFGKELSRKNSGWVLFENLLKNLYNKIYCFCFLRVDRDLYLFSDKFYRKDFNFFFKKY